MAIGIECSIAIMALMYRPSSTRGVAQEVFSFDHDRRGEKTECPRARKAHRAATYP